MPQDTGSPIQHLFQECHTLLIFEDFVTKEVYDFPQT